MAPRPSRQERNLAGRDIAGRDITHNHSYNLNPASTLRELATELRLAADHETQHAFIDRLQHFTEPISEGPGRDLAKKLEAASRADLLDHALEWKEQFYKKLLRLQFSRQAQELFVHILSKIHTFFMLRVRPRVRAHAPRTEVDALIYELITELYSEVGNSELDITMTDLEGMVYFLAGNCHIDWT